ncbi:2302_t:CDS:2, partial [Entrophospora sp. SA101]
MIDELYIKQNLLKSISIKSQKITNLIISDETFESELKFLISRQRNLNKIIARNCNFEKSIFKSLMDYCNNSLSVLEFYNFRFEPMSLDLLRQCKNLKILKLEFVKYNGSKELYRLLGQIKFLKLKNLSLKLIDYETSYDAQYNFGPTIEEFYEIFKTNGLNLNILKLEINFEKYSEALSIIGKNCKNLKEVEVIGNYDVKDLLIFLNQPLNLKKLSLGSSDIDPIEILLQIPNLIAIKKLSYFYTNWVFYTSEILNILNNWEAPCLEFSYWCAENLLELHEKMFINYYQERINRNLNEDKIKKMNFMIKSIVYWDLRRLCLVVQTGEIGMGTVQPNPVQPAVRNRTDAVWFTHFKPRFNQPRMSIDKRIDNAALSPTSIVQIFDNDTNNSSSIMQIPDINNSIQIHDIML